MLTHVFSVMDVTRGARSEALTTEPVDPGEVGEDRPWMDSLVEHACGSVVGAYTHAIALQRVDSRSLWAIGERRRPVVVVRGMGRKILCRGCGCRRRGRRRSDLGRTQGGCRHTMLQSIAILIILAILRVCLALVLDRLLTCGGAATAMSAQLCKKGRHGGGW